MKEPGQIAHRAWSKSEFWHYLSEERKELWAAVEAAVIEECAKVAEGKYHGFDGYGKGRVGAAAEIRALANPSPAAPVSPETKKPPAS